ncbi:MULTISPECIES: DUF4097 family beta strand repeat-containing protein [unclassified Ruminococcus]|uniref:DUF4097 family beta strand repeat-containing protein n=1 Tax=unclassified Ruminococcus TaxID=2608920 RepID=UPI00189962F1|nr:MULTISPECIES: DUF4097 family beta strand repeat-containing protein [unclassified Ruminococcus]MDB8754527.1 DUF4097 family beta strand repeat-containing protein [Ruminococcus sp. 1001136sp1]MDB8759041.1 DUF4097 family beta strand repeat-containing protein [Ruminococcus sp. 1001136sp1]MDB8762728.1 DUF4097 family beta strand repeat-containing protein [Ruminococcus sp. 1001136sp1]MDB8767464.1 DUF4097 family beta strand repeat-containing protein [Ruminococcus sp. 1001136sp1]
MKKGTKGMLIAAGAFAVAGIGFCIGGISVAAVETGGNVFDQAGQLLQDNDYPLAGLIHWGNAQYHSSDIDWDALDGNTVDMDFASDLEISLKYDELLIQEYDGDKIRVNVANDAKNDVVVKETSGKIMITDTRSGNVKKKKQIKVIVPSGKDFDTVSLGVDMGTIDLECDLKVQELSMEVGAGEFSGYGNITAAYCDLQVGAGTIDIDQLDIQKLNADCGAGEIDMVVTGKEKDYNYDLSCGMGEINLEDSEYSGLGIEKNISNEGARKDMVLECGMGEIDVEFTGES